MRFTVTEHGSALLLSSPDLAGWSRVIRGRDALWHAIGDARRRMPPAAVTRAYPAPDDDTAGRDERRDGIPALVNDGWTIRRIAVHFGVHQSTIRDDMAACHIRPLQRVVNEAQKRRADVAELHRQGCTAAVIADRLGVHVNTVYTDLGQLRRQKKAS